MIQSELLEHPLILQTTIENNAEQRLAQKPERAGCFRGRTASPVPFLLWPGRAKVHIMLADS